MPNPLLTEVIERLARRENLPPEEARAALGEIMAGRASDAQTAAFLIALRTKGETVDEIVGLAEAMRERALPVTLPDGVVAIDTAGTGGGRPTFNVSTTAALIAAAAGVTVAKHGNRSATSRSGSADLLEALGACIELPPELIARTIAETGFGFMFAPLHHAATRHVVPVRRELAVRTIFNFLGPLTNPAGVRRQVIGVADKAFLEPLAAALARLGCDHCLVVASADGLDEISASAPTAYVEVRDGETRSGTIDPATFGIEPIAVDRVRAGDPGENAAITRAILAGERIPERTVAVINAAAALYVAGAVGTLREGAERAAAAVDSGAAAELLERWVQMTRELAPVGAG